MLFIFLSAVLALAHADSCDGGECPSESPVDEEAALLQVNSEWSPKPNPYRKGTSVTVTWGGVSGGVMHDRYENDIDWTFFNGLKNFDCSRVCRGPNNQCYPVKDNGYFGTPCGILSQGNPQGCFFNGPTQTCALCTTAQAYCCPTSSIKDCKKQR